jgi:hypothetical protein
MNLRIAATSLLEKMHLLRWKGSIREGIEGIPDGPGQMIAGFALISRSSVPAS